MHVLLWLLGWCKVKDPMGIKISPGALGSDSRIQLLIFRDSQKESKKTPSESVILFRPHEFLNIPGDSHEHTLIDSPICVQHRFWTLCLPSCKSTSLGKKPEKNIVLGT